MNTQLEAVYSEWQNNPEFRNAFNKNPNSALKKWGFKLSKTDLENILKFKKTNEELEKRVNK